MRLPLCVCVPLIAVGLAVPAQASAGTRVDAVVLGSAKSPLLAPLHEAMGSRLRLVRHGERMRPRRVARFDLVILDGDRVAARTLRRSPAVRAAVRAGRWLLVVDPDRADLRRGLRAHSGFASGQANVGAQLMRRSTGSSAHASVQTLEVPPAPRGRGRRAALQADADLIRDELLSDRSEARAAANDAIPSEVQHVRYVYKAPGRVNFGCQGGPQDYQMLNHLTTYTYDVFLDNSIEHPQGSFQWIAATIDGGVAPALADQTICHNDELWRRLWTAWVDLTLEPIDGSRLTLTQSLPETNNGSTTYTSGSKVDIGFSAGASSKEGAHAGVDASYSWEHSEEHTVRDWTVRSETAQNTAKWRFYSSSPCNTDGGQLDKDGCFRISDNSGYPNRPNDLSLGRMPYVTSAVWRTEGLVDGPVTFRASVQPAWASTRCAARFLNVSCTDRDPWIVDSRDTKQFPGFADSGWTGIEHTIDVGAVIPVGVESLTFSPGDRVAAATKVVGTLKLDRPARTRVVVPLSSDDPHVQPQANVTFDRGQRQANFEILTNANGLAAGDAIAATVTAFYAEPTRAQLNVVRPAATKTPKEPEEPVKPVEPDEPDSDRPAEVQPSG
jgi:hypothetical protein